MDRGKNKRLSIKPLIVAIVVCTLGFTAGYLSNQFSTATTPARNTQTTTEPMNHCPLEGKEHLAPNDPSCVVPNTGPGAIIGGIVGVGALVTAVTYYLLSQKQLKLSKQQQIDLTA